MQPHPQKYYHMVCFAAFSGILLCTPFGVYADVWTQYTQSNSCILDNYVTAVSLSPDGSMWFATGKGVSRFDGVSWRSYPNGVFLGSNDIFTGIAVDSRGIIWLADSHRIVRLDPSDGSTRIIVSELVSRTASGASVMVDWSGRIWYGAWGGIAVSDGSFLTPVFVESGASARRVTDITIGPDGALWFARMGGALVFDGSMAVDVEAAAFLDITAAAADSSGGVWFGLNAGGAVRCTENTREDYLDVGELSGGTVHAIVADTKGNVWFATESGVAMYDGLSWRGFTSDDGLPHDFVHDITVDKEGRIWVATVGGAACYEAAP